MRKLSGLKPQSVFAYFEDICNIPHGSGNTKAISDYCVNFAKERGLSYNQDDCNNVIIRKAASKGYESHPTVILQGHLDMVCEKLPECDFNFLTDPLKLCVDGDFISAKGTTLGGDDGIAVALVLAILADNSLKHPPIEAVFTTDEETGMYGAWALDASLLKGRTFINIDSDEMGTLTVSCAGGARTDLTIPVAKESVNAPCFEITISGLCGGHSGTEINKGRLNANKLMGAFLLNVTEPLNILSLNGGEKDNVITSECYCRVSTNADLTAIADAFVEANTIPSEPTLAITISPIAPEKLGFSAEATQKVISFVCELPFGVQKMSEDIEGLVETSLNLGVLKTDSDALRAGVSVRSSVASGKQALLQTLCNITEKYGGTFACYGDYPEWEYRKDSPLREKMVAIYRGLFGNEPQVTAIHAGLECGIFASQLQGFDGISVGPDLFDIHTPRERLSISSVGLLYHYLLKTLEVL